MSGLPASEELFVANLNSGVAWQLTLSRPKRQKENTGGQVQANDTNAEDGDLCILMFRPLISSDKAVSIPNTILQLQSYV